MQPQTLNSHHSKSRLCVHLTVQGSQVDLPRRGLGFQAVHSCHLSYLWIFFLHSEMREGVGDYVSRVHRLVPIMIPTNYRAVWGAPSPECLRESRTVNPQHCLCHTGRRKSMHILITGRPLRLRANRADGSVCAYGLPFTQTCSKMVNRFFRRHGPVRIRKMKRRW